MQIPGNFIQRNGIFFLIALFFLAGLNNIMLPIFDEHGWRQALTLSIAHNFLEHPNIFYPRMDIGGETEGIISCEFPLYNYILAGIFRVFGIHDWLGRLLNWTISCAGLFFFYDLVRKLFQNRAAIFATVALMSSITFEYARKSMPDTFAMSLTLVGIWFAWQYLDLGRRAFLISAGAFISLGILSKIPSLIALAILLAPFLDKNIALSRKKNLALVIGTSLVPVLAWYFVWMPYLLERYKNPLIFPVSLTEGWRVIMYDRWPESWEKITDAPFYGKMPFFFAIMGLGALLTGTERRYTWFALAYLLLFTAFALKTGEVFSTHHYYSIPLVFLWAMTIGLFIDRLGAGNLLSGLLLLALMLPSYLVQKERSYTPKVNRSYLSSLAVIVARYVKPGEKIIVNDGQFNPGMMYWAKRKGWTVNQDVPARQTWMPDYKRLGMKCMVIDRNLLKDTLPYCLLYEDQNFRIYQP